MTIDPRARQAIRERLRWQKPWSGVVFRSVPLEFAKPEKIVDGEGAMKSGAQRIPPGNLRVCDRSHGQIHQHWPVTLVTLVTLPNSAAGGN